MSVPNLVPSFYEDRFAPLLYGCLEAVGSTKGVLYLREGDGGFRCVAHYGWPRGAMPPARIPVLDPLLILVQRARRSIAVNDLAQFPELKAFGEGSESPRLFVSPVYLMGDWVALLVQRDKQRNEPYDEEADAAATLGICNQVAAELKALRTREAQAAPEDLPPILEAPPEPMQPLVLSSTQPMRPPADPEGGAGPAPRPAQAEPSARSTGEVLSGYTSGLEAVAWEGESQTLPGTVPAESSLPGGLRQGMFLPEQRSFFWGIAILMARLVPCGALAFWMEEPGEIRPLLCFSPEPLSDGLKQQILAHATFQLPRIREQDLRLLSWSPEGGGSPLEGGFASQSTLPVGKGSEDLLMVFRREYAPLDERELRALAPALRLLAQFLAETRTHQRYHQAFLSFAHRILASAETRAPGLRAHSLGCARLAQAFAIHLDLPSRDMEALAIAAILHDVGRLMLDPALFRKGELSEADWVQVRTHPAQAGAFLQDLEFPFDVLGIIEAHHERWDGTGYPKGLAGDAIPLGARILALVDAAEAMAEGRSQKPPKSPREVLAELQAQSGLQFDPALVEAYARMATLQELPTLRSADEG